MKKLIYIIGLVFAAGVIHAQTQITFPAPTADQINGLQYVVSVANASLIASGETNWTWTAQTYARTNVVQHLQARYTAILDNYTQQWRDAEASSESKREKIQLLRNRLPELTPAQLDTIIAALP